MKKDCLKVHCDKNLTMPPELSRGEILRFLAGHFDSLGFIAPYLLEGKLIFHRATCAGIDWDDERMKNIVIDFSAWLSLAACFGGFYFPLLLWGTETGAGG